jgi:hypothetical protein
VKNLCEGDIWVNLLDTITVISLHKHYLFRDILALFWCTKANETAEARVRLLVSVRNTHPTTNGNIEAFELAVLTDDRDETNVIGKDVDVVGRRNRYCDFELGCW